MRGCRERRKSGAYASGQEGSTSVVCAGGNKRLVSGVLLTIETALQVLARSERPALARTRCLIDRVVLCTRLCTRCLFLLPPLLSNNSNSSIARSAEAPTLHQPPKVPAKKARNLLPPTSNRLSWLSWQSHGGHRWCQGPLAKRASGFSRTPHTSTAPPLNPPCGAGPLSLLPAATHTATLSLRRMGVAPCARDACSAL